MSDLAKRLAFNRHLPRHLSEMSRLVNREVRKEDLLSVEETYTVLARAKAVARVSGWKCEMPFKDKGSSRFQNLIRTLQSLTPGKVFVWTPLAGDCGLFRAVSLSEIDFGFAFDLNPEGIMEVLTEDLIDRMLLDYSMGQNGEEILDLEVDGVRWGNARY